MTNADNNGGHDGHAKILQFMQDASLSGAKRCDRRSKEVASDVTAALQWTRKRRPTQVIEEREAIICAIEKRGAEFKQNGQAASWLSGGCKAATSVSLTVNGPLFEVLARESGHSDAQACDILKNGAQLVGELPYTGLGSPHVFEEQKCIAELRSSCGKNNHKLFHSLAPDPCGKLSIGVFLCGHSLQLYLHCNTH